MNTINENGSKNITSVIRLDRFNKMEKFIETRNKDDATNVNFYYATNEKIIDWLLDYLTVHKLTENREINIDSDVILLIFSKGITSTKFSPEVVIESVENDEHALDVIKYLRTVH